MKKLILIFFIFLAGCSTAIKDYESGYGVESTYDEFEKTTRTALHSNVLDGGHATLSSVQASAMNIIQYKKPDTTIYQLQYIYVADEWLFIGEDNSLSLLVDGEKYDFSAYDNFRETIDYMGGVKIREYVYYPVSKDMLEKIANAKIVKVKVSGRQYYVQSQFNKSNFKNFKKFLAQHGK
ncbi:MAG: hypothetical protein KC483_02600 [Nitrosarchaeum sp.]|nr:hypothetical protein [Nitrosarchaeum sp.]